MAHLSEAPRRSPLRISPPKERERGMATTAKDEALLKAADLTAKQLQQAIEIVEGKAGKERAESDGALVGAVLEVLATNYRHATR